MRFYLDADVLGLAHVVADLRSDATYPGDPGAIIKRRERRACPIVDPATKDDVWIPEVASRGWLIITVGAGSFEATVSTAPSSRQKFKLSS